MGAVLKMPAANPKTIDVLVKEIRTHLYDAKGAESKYQKHRLTAGQKLLELRARIEAGEAGDGVSWWEWFASADISRSRKDAEKLMRMARSDDPEAAHEAEKTETRERMKTSRGAHVRSSEDEYDIVSHAMNLVAKMSEEEREEFNTKYMEKYDV
jgi:hypothetical protein